MRFDKDHITPNSTLLSQLLNSPIFSNRADFPLLTELQLFNGWLANACVVTDYRSCGRNNCRCQTEGKLHSRYVIKYRVKVDGKWVQKKQHLRLDQVEQAKTEIDQLKGYRQLFRNNEVRDALIHTATLSQSELIAFYYAERGSTVIAAESRALKKEFKYYEEKLTRLMGTK